RATEWGFDALKFFPASASGGASFLSAVGAVLPQVLFCPTGGVKPDNAADYLALPNVPCVGGSWLTKRDADGRIDPAVVTDRARAAGQL
ncbi:MAG: keto-deoxy-phosphogluconate aldolase, partial [Myxococcota bacterium]